jgi:glutamate---cysteine ligase / carboxylate-amine ligase
VGALERGSVGAWEPASCSDDTEALETHPREVPAGKFTLGVEEEYQIIDPETRALRPRATRVLQQAQRALGDEVQTELRLSQIETATPVCSTLAEVRSDLTRMRRELILAAQRDGDRIVAAGTHPFSHPEEQPFTPKRRYQEMAVDYQRLAREQVIFGCHVHVGMDDPEAAVQVMNRARVWLSPLLALGASSPFWIGEDTGYASFRTEVWIRWPMSGQPQLFASRAEYDALVQALIETGIIEDTTHIYWDIRLPQRVPTVEFRVSDVCPTIDEAVMTAGLVRGLARTCYEAALHDEPYCAARPELLRAAHWQAARYGLTGKLIDVHAHSSVLAGELVQELLQFVRPGLEAAGDWEEVSSLVQETLARGNGADRQRDVYQRAESLEEVVDFLIAETSKGTGLAPVQ